MRSSQCVQNRSESIRDTTRKKMSDSYIMQVDIGLVVPKLLMTGECSGIVS